MEPPSLAPKFNPSFVAIVAVALAANIWYDYYHPAWLFFDAVIAIFLIKYAVSRYKLN
jgi:hypothetical protein